MRWSVNKTSDDGCIFIVRPQVLPASHMDTHGTGVLAGTRRPTGGGPRRGACVATVCVDECVRACYMAYTSSGVMCV